MPPKFMAPQPPLPSLPAWMRHSVQHDADLTLFEAVLEEIAPHKIAHCYESIHVPVYKLESQARRGGSLVSIVNMINIGNIKPGRSAGQSEGVMKIGMMNDVGLPV